MTERKEYAHGEFSWVDLSANDLAKAKDWYGKVLGWKAVDQDTKGGPPYTFFQFNGKGVAGGGQLSDEMKAAGVPPMWNSYATVKDAKAIEAKVAELGGKVTVPTMKVMDAGSLAFFLDPEGASFAVWQPDKHAGAELCNAPSSFAWNELMTRDVARAKDFYGKLFGWEFVDMPMGPTTYAMIKNNGRDNGGIMQMDENMAGVPAHWGVYFGVDDTDATVATVTELGGQVRVPPTDVPPGRFAVLADAQGAGFAVIKMNNPPA